MAKELPCPKCKSRITIDDTRSGNPQSVQCSNCGSTFNLTKKPKKPLPDAMIVAEAVTPNDVSPATDAINSLDFAALNIHALPTHPDSDPFAETDPFATLPEATQQFGSQSYEPPSYYGQVATPNESHQGSGRESIQPAGKLPIQRLILIASSAVGGLAVLFCGVLGLVFARGYMLANKDVANMRLVGLAFHNYESTYKRLPAPTSFNGNREPVWSWTVSVLQFTDDAPRFEGAKHMLSMLPWDSPENELLRGPTPSLFRSARSYSGPTDRNVFVISKTGSQPRTANDEPLFIEGMYRKFPDFTDGMANTILAIQFTKYSQPWAQPGEVSIDQAYELLQKEPRVCLVVMGDGVVTWLPNTLSRKEFNALATSSAGDNF